jgi:NTP pyrophosphatase (non-canonical NTP hydrolase)
MTLNEYQDFVSHGIRPEAAGKNRMVHFALGLAGETGEVCDAIKKREYHGRDISIEHIKEEIGDVMWYIANLCNEFEFDLNDVIVENARKLVKRYPDLYAGYEEV